MNQDQATAALERRRLIDATYEYLASGVRNAVHSIFPLANPATPIISPPELIAGSHPETATFTIAIRRGQYSAVFFISLFGTGNVLIEEQGGKPFEAVMKEDGLRYLRACVVGFASKAK